MKTKKEEAERLFNVFYESITGLDFVHRNIDKTKPLSSEDKAEIINRLTAKICACECCEEISLAIKEYDKYHQVKTIEVKGYYDLVMDELNDLWN